MSYIGITKQLRMIADSYANVDANYGPYQSKRTALLTIPEVLRKEGLTLGIIENGVVTEYWFNGGISDENLILKSGSSSDFSDIIAALAEKVDKERDKFLMTRAERDFIQALIDGGGTGGGTELAILKALFLSKVEEDVAKEKITFDKGLISGGLARLTDTYFGNFSSGIHTGKGGAIDNDGHGELESLIVRSFLEVPELRYNKLSLIGEEIAVGAGGVIEEVSTISTGYRIKLKLEEGEMNPFWYDDIIKGIFHHQNGFRTTYGRVVSPTDANNPYLDIVLRPSSGNITYAAPVPFMHIGRWGNFNSNPSLDTSDRQSLLVLSAKTGSITFYDGMKDYSGGYINSQWGKPKGLEFLDIEDLDLDPNAPVLYLKTLLVEDIIRIDHEGETIVTVRDRGLWSLEVATGTSPYINSSTIVDEVWHNKTKYRCIQDKTTEEPFRYSENWLYLYELGDGLASIDIIFSQNTVILKADKNGVIENSSHPQAKLKIEEGVSNLIPIFKSETKINGSFWIDDYTAVNITALAAGKDSVSKALVLSSKDITTSPAYIIWKIKGKRFNGTEFERDIRQDFIIVQDGKGLQVNIKGSVETIGEEYPILPQTGDKHLKMYDGRIHTWDGTNWIVEGISTPGDAWVVNTDGHIYIWDGSSWNDSGEFKGDPGEGAVVHFAYADIVLRDGAGDQYVPENGGFTLDDYADKVWLGVYWDHNVNDSLNSRRYQWTHVKGGKGDKGADGTSVSIKGKVDTPMDLPSSDIILGDGYISEDTGDLWIYDGNTQEIDATFGWVNAGKIQGDSNYIHIAWADDVVFDLNGDFQYVVNFDLIDGNKKRWHGLYVDDIKQDALEAEAHKYNWTDTKGDAGKDSKSDEFIYIRTNNRNFSDVPPSEPDIQDYVPEHLGWTDDPVGVDEFNIYEFVSTRKFRENEVTGEMEWGAFSTPSIWAIFATDGEPGKDSKSDEYIYYKTNNINFNTTPPTKQEDDYIPKFPQWTGPGEWTDDPEGVTELEPYEFVSKRIYRNDLWSTFSKPSLWAKWSENAKNPYAAYDTTPGGQYNDGKKYWFIWVEAQKKYVNSGDPSQGDNGNAPRVHSSGFWEVWGDMGDGTFGYILTEFRAVPKDGQSSFKSIVFKRSTSVPDTPLKTSGDYSNPVPPGWSDGIPLGNEPLWGTTRIFTENGLTPQQLVWTTPRIMADSADFDVAFSSLQNKPSPPENHPNEQNNIWSDIADENTKWMATSTKTGSTWSDWQVFRVKGEDAVDITFSTNSHQIIKTKDDEYIPAQINIILESQNATFESGSFELLVNGAYSGLSIGNTPGFTLTYYSSSKYLVTINSKLLAEGITGLRTLTIEAQTDFPLVTKQFSIGYIQDGKAEEIDPTKVATPYMAGEWEGTTAVNGSSTKVYFRNDFVYPVVSFGKVGGKPQYYFLKRKATLPIGSKKPSIDSTNWQKADGFEMVITEAIFSNFAKLGSFIFNGRSMISQQGVIEGAYSEEYTEDEFIPYFRVNGETGRLDARYAFIEGKIIATEGEIGGFKIQEGKIDTPEAGLSGVAGVRKDNPAFWAGGTYSQAFGGTAKAIIRHDGTSKFSDTDITGTVNATDGSFRGKVSVPFVIIDSFTSGSIINLDNSFNISTHSYMGDKTVYLPIDEKYNGVVCHIHNGGRTQNEGTFEVKIQGNQVFEGRKRGAQIQSINIGTGQIGAFICLKDISGSIGWACTNYADLQL